MPPNAVTVSSTIERGERLVTQIALERDASPARRIDLSERVHGILRLFGQVRDRDIRALAGERDRDRAPDAGVAAGDQGTAAAQPVVADVRVFAVVGSGRGVCGQPGLVLLLRGEPVGGVLRTRVGHLFGHGRFLPSATQPRRGGDCSRRG